MSGALTRGALTGRPFGGVAFLWHSSLSKCIEVVKNDIEGRCGVIKLKLFNRTVLLFNLYLPCFDGSSEYKTDLCFYAGFITDVLESVDHTDCVIMGDFNFECDVSNLCDYVIFKPLLDQFDLIVGDNFLPISNRHTYVNEALRNASCIDHFFHLG